MYILKIPLKGRIVGVTLSVVLGTAAQTTVLLVTDSYGLYRWLSLLIIGPVMAAKSVGGKIKPVKLWFLTMSVTMVTGGIVYALESFLSTDITIMCAIAFIIAYAASGIWCEAGKHSRKLYRVMLFEGEKRVFLTALYDSGNSLRMVSQNPLSQSIPVHIGGEKVFSIIENGKEFYRIPFKSLGNESGMIEACYFDGMVVESKGKKWQINNVLIGRASANLLKNTAYDMILNEAVFTDKKSVESDMGRWGKPV